jgi:hypothetical protein
VPKPGELWTYGQAMVWIVCALGDFASPAERDGLIASCAPERIGQPERTPLSILFSAQYWPSVQSDLGEQVKSESGEELGQVRGARFTDAWKESTTALLDEVNRGQINIFGVDAAARGALAQIDRLAAASLVLGEEFQDTIAMVSGDHKPRWRSIRFDAKQIETRWPDRSPSPPLEVAAADVRPEQSAKAKAKVGAPTKYDWNKWQEALEGECCLQESIPHEAHSDPKWRTQADAINYLNGRFNSRGGGPSPSRMRAKVARMLAQIDAKRKAAQN